MGMVEEILKDYYQNELNRVNRNIDTIELQLRNLETLMGMAFNEREDYQNKINELSR